ncbi:hypothetical protein FHX42_000351 [Saccharopolyspora lacisalsi]|uniref:Uncharacterized protein n=1 Tax=Halosaccharopolyspora lacisalsi TaxID=1000566 RepID=A0A839DM30_9PSEU|nr:hypothetical protein [Halosaccharopolyspora lacisalsi]
MLDMMMPTAPGHLVSGVTALCGIHGEDSGYGHALVRQRGFHASPETSSCRFVRKRSP